MERKLIIVDGTTKGLTIRDYFATAALTGHIARFQDSGCWSIGDIVESSYEYADLMLAEREKNETN